MTRLRDFAYRALLAFAVAYPLVSRASAAENQSTEQLVVTLDVPDEAPPELFCVIGDQPCKGERCHDLANLEDAMTVNQGRVVFDATRLKQTIADEVLRAAITGLSRTPSAGCEQCRPAMQLIDDMRSPSAKRGQLSGFIACARNSRPTQSDRVALVYLKFNGLVTTPVPLRAVELIGNQTTIYFLRSVDIRSYAFLMSIGGDYLENTTGLGTRERMTLRMNPRCTLEALELPRRRPATGEHRELRLDGVEIDRCVEESNGATHVWLPHRTSRVTSKLQIEYMDAQKTSSHGRYEAAWTGPAPPRPLKIQQRGVELSWRRHCLAGRLPNSADPSWTSACPRVSLPLAGGSCRAEERGSSCRYWCDVPDAMSAFDLPTPVHFQRGTWDETVSRPAYEWSDTLVYAGQELGSFVAPAERKIIVEFPHPERWQSHFGNELDRIDIRIDEQLAQSIPIGEIAPSWAAVSAPNATCASQFSIDVVGARSFSRELQRRDEGGPSDGNLVLSSPDHYGTHFHWTASVGAGLVFPITDPVGGGRGEPFLSVSLGGEHYFAWPFSGAFEGHLVYEPTMTAYGAVTLSNREDGKLITVPYHRTSLQGAIVIWSKRRKWQFGLTGGIGVGRPIFPISEKVGANNLFWLAGGFVRFRPSPVNGWVETFAGPLWGEDHQYFGTDATGAPRPDTFHGEPTRTERGLFQLIGGMRWRMTFR